MSGERFPVTYTCSKCGNEFTVTQGDPDEDISLCRACTELILGKSARKWS